MGEIASTQADIVWGEDGVETLIDALNDSVARYGLQSYRVLNEHGPGGGWPFVEFFGTREACERFEQAFEEMADGKWSPEKYPLPV